jgi:hypothetical protein
MPNSCFIDPWVLIFNNLYIEKELILTENIYDQELKIIFEGLNNGETVTSEKLMSIYFKNFKNNEIIKLKSTYLKDQYGKFHPTAEFFYNFLILNNNNTLQDNFSLKLYEKNKFICNIFIDIILVANLQIINEYIMKLLISSINKNKLEEEIKIDFPKHIVLYSEKKLTVPDNFKLFQFEYQKIYEIRYLNNHFYLYIYTDKKIYLIDTSKSKKYYIEVEKEKILEDPYLTIYKKTKINNEIILGKSLIHQSLYFNYDLIDNTLELYYENIENVKKLISEYEKNEIETEDVSKKKTEINSINKNEIIEDAKISNENEFKDENNKKRKNINEVFDKKKKIKSCGCKNFICNRRCGCVSDNKKCNSNCKCNCKNNRE